MGSIIPRNSKQPFFKWMFGDVQPFFWCKDSVNQHPTETTIYRYLSRVPGIYPEQPPRLAPPTRGYQSYRRRPREAWRIVAGTHCGRMLCLAGSGTAKWWDWNKFWSNLWLNNPTEKYGWSQIGSFLEILGVKRCRKNLLKPSSGYLWIFTLHF